MAKPHHALTPEKEREQLEALLGRPVESGPGIHVVTMFDPDEGELVLDEATSLLEALRCLARHIARDGADAEEVAQLPSSGPLSRLELEAMSDLLDSSMDRTTSPGGDSYLGAITEERPDLELVVGWDAAAPLQDLAFGIYRASASTTKAPAPSAPAGKTPAPAAPTGKPARVWNLPPARLRQPRRLSDPRGPPLAVTSLALRCHVPGAPVLGITPLSDGHRFAVANRDVAALYDAADGSHTRPVRVAPSRAHAVSQDGRWLAFLREPPDSRAMTVVALDRGQRLRLEGIYDDFEHVLAFVPGTARLHTLFMDGSNNGGYFAIQEYDLGALRLPPPGKADDEEPAVEVNEKTAFESDVMLTMVHAPSGKRLLVYEAGSVSAVDLTTRRRKAVIGEPAGEEGEGGAPEGGLVALFAVAAGGERVLAVQADARAGDYLEDALMAPLGERVVVQLSEVKTGRRLLRASLRNRWGEVDAGQASRGLSLDPSGRRLVRAGGRSVRLYDLERMASRFRRRPLVPRRGDVLRTWRAPRRVTQVAFLPDGEHVLAVCGRELVVWHVDHDEPRATWRGKPIVAWGVSTGGFVAVGDAGGGVWLGQLVGYRAPHPVDSRSTGWSPWPFDASGEG